MKLDKDALILAQVLGGGGGGITPTGNQDITTLDEYDVTDKATARVSATERAKIIPENIKKDVEVLGVTGTYSGGGQSAPSNDVNFYDYDGTIVYSYSAADFANLAAMPDNPSHEGLTAQGWNWSLADAKTYVANHGMLEIGQMYITDDGKTRLYISIATTGRMSPTLYFSQTVANGVTIDWGDNSATETATGTGSKTATHTYSAIGNYVITLNPADGCSLGLGYNSPSLQTVFGFRPLLAYMNMLTKVELGRGISSISQAAFWSHYSLGTITIPYGITDVGKVAFQSCCSLRCLIMPMGANAAASGDMLYDCPSLSAISLPKEWTLQANRLAGDTSLRIITFPDNSTQSELASLDDARALSKIALSNSITTIPIYAFRYCYSLANISFPAGITQIQASAFDNCTSMKIYDFTACTSVPTLANSNAFNQNSSDFQILVPAALYDTWKAASNWSTYASKMVAV